MWHIMFLLGGEMELYNTIIVPHGEAVNFRSRKRSEIWPGGANANAFGVRSFKIPFKFAMKT